MQNFLYRLNNLPKYLIAAVLVIVVLYPKFPLIKIPGIYVSVRLEDFLMLLLGILTTVKILGNLKIFVKDKIFVAFALFFAAGIISLIAGVFLTRTVDLHIGVLHVLRRLEYAVPLFATFSLFKRGDAKNNLGFYIKVLMIVILVAFIYGLGERYFGFPVIDTQNDEYSKGVALFWTPGAHINATFAGHYDLAAFIVLVLPIFSTIFFMTGQIKVKLLALLSILPGLWLLGASLSRVSLVSWVIAASFPLLVLKKKKAVVLVLFAAACVIMMFPSLLGRYQRFLDVYAANAAPTPTSFPAALMAPAPPIFEDRSTSIRLNVEWPRAVRAITKNPILGTGYSSITLATDNDYLRALGETGILGLSAFVLIFIGIGKEIVAFYKRMDRFSFEEKAFILAITGSAIGTFVTAFFIDIFEASKFATIFWLLIAYAVILVRDKGYD